MFNEKELASIYNCVSFHILTRLKKYEKTLKDDPILNHLYELEVKILSELDKIREAENA